MLNIHPDFLIDEKYQKKAVVIPFNERKHPANYTLIGKI